MNVAAMPIKNIFLVVGLLVFIPSIHAQIISRPYYNLKNYTTKDGLNSNNCTWVQKDSKGFLWIGSDRGVQRFNGSSFITYRHLNADSNSLVNDYISYIMEDSDHDIWLATADGISKFNYRNGKFTNFSVGYNGSEKIKMGDMFWLLQDSKGRLWAGARSGMFLFNKQTNRFENYPPQKDSSNQPGFFVRVSCIRENKKGEIIFSVIDGFVIIGTDGKQQYLHMPLPDVKIPNHIPTNQLMLPEDYPDEIWVSANLNGLFKYERSKNKWTNYLSKGVLVAELVKKACIAWNKDEWLLGYDNLCFFNHRTGVFRQPFDKSLRSVYNICRDENNILWITSNVNGLYRVNLSDQLYSSMEHIPGITPDKIFYFDKEANAIYGVNMFAANGMFKFSLADSNVVKDSIRGLKPFVTVLNSYIANKDILYLAMEKGFWKYDLNKHRLDSIEFKIGGYSSQQAFFFNLYQAGDKIYFSGKFGNGGPFVYDLKTGSVTDLALAYQATGSGKNLTYYPSVTMGQTSPHGQVNANDLPLFYEKSKDPPLYSFGISFHKNILYVSMNQADSLYTYNIISGEQKRIPIPAEFKGTKPAAILSMCVDNNENLWCGTSGNGLMVYNIPASKWIRHIGQPEGYFPVITSDLLCDEDGVVWCVTSEGIYTFNPGTFKYRRYTAEDGLGMENWDGKPVLLPGHRLLNANVSSPWETVTFAIINTHVIDTGVRLIPISITDLKLMDRHFMTDTLLDNVQSVTFPPNQNSFSLNYAGVTLTGADELLYEYRLDGVDDGWHRAGKERHLSYLNLSPGTYTLHIRCGDRNGSVVGKERQLIIKLLPAWYQAWWFKVLALLIAVAFLYAAVQYYLRQEIKKREAVIERERALETERQRIAADMHDDVGAGLSRIRFITAAMKDGRQMSTEEMDKILSLSDESVERMNEIIWSLNQGNQPLEELIYYMRAQFAEMVTNAGMQFNCDMPDDIPALTLPWDKNRNIYLLIKEAVNNAVKHSKANTVNINFNISRSLLITVADDGIGFSEETVKRQGNGLLNYKKRIESLAGSWNIQSGNGEGTKLVFNIPLA